MQITYRNEATVKLSIDDVREAVRQYVKAAHPDFAVNNIALKWAGIHPDAAVVDVKRIPPSASEPKPFDKARYETPLKSRSAPNGRPLSHWTVLGYLAFKKPDLLRVMDDAADATVRDGLRLTALCKRHCVSPRKCAAPPVLREQGITEVNAYPLFVLREHFGF